MTKLSTVGEELVRLLHAHGVDTVFGIPGVHTVPLYRGLANGPIRHITPRHEQAAAFMADGLARVSGQPGVCFLITGPGLTNAATAMAQAYADSVPMLVITSVNPARSPEKGEGRLHELPDQSAFARTVAASTHNLESASELPGILAQIFSQFRSKRPRPIHLQISTDLLATQCSVLRAVEPAISTPVASASDIEIAATLLDDALRPLIIAGGGSQHADAILGEVAERLDAPVVTTLAAKGVIADQHALCVGAGLGHEHVRDEIREADVVLVVGSELAPTDLWPHESLDFTGRLIRVDIDSHHLDFEPRADLALVGDSAQVLSALQADLQRKPAQNRQGAERTRRLRKNAEYDDRFERWLVPLRKCLADDTIFCADSTQIVYQAGASFPMYQPRQWLTSVTGFGTLGYALPAALGASLWLQSKGDSARVICLIGDGGLQFTLAELMTLRQLSLSVDVVVWNNQGYGEIRDSMLARDVEPAGVDIASPDIVQLGAAFDIPARRVTQPGELTDLLQRETTGPRIIDVNLLG